jgi:uroporphyrinogen-III synthase
MSGPATEQAVKVRVAGSLRRVLVTRPSDQAQAWVEALRAGGVDALALPLIDTAACTDPTAVIDAWSGLDQWSALVFVSPNAVRHFFERRPAAVTWPPTLMAAAPGPGTAAELQACGIDLARIIQPAADSASFDSESLWLRLQDHDWRGRRVLIVRGESGRDWLAERLRQAGAAVDLLAAYRRSASVLDEAQRTSLLSALAEPARHLWLFSSSESVEQLLRTGLAGAGQLQRSVAMATHPRIAQTAAEAGFGKVIETRPSLSEVLRCIQSAPAPDISG